MNLRSVMVRVRGGDVFNALGRFKVVRTTYSGLRDLAAHFDNKPARHSDGATLFPALDLAHVVKAVREDAVFVGLTLPAGIVAEIEAFARSEPLHAIYDPKGPTLLYSDLVRG